jgi:predicted DNA-binding transcriptional regulator AlpA
MTPNRHERRRRAAGHEHEPERVEKFQFLQAVYTVAQTQQLLGISRTKLWQLERDRELKPGRIGRRVVFFAEDIAAFLQRLRQAA